MDIPNPGIAGLQGAVLNNYLLNTARPTYDKQAQFQPLYTDLGLEGLFQTLNGRNGLPGILQQYADANTNTRTANLNDVTNLGPGAINAFRGMSDLNGQLYDQARTGLNMGSRIAPNDAYRITSGVRGDWANRGLGGSAPAQLDEALQLFGGGEQLRQSRQQFAQGVAGNENNSVLPWLTQNSQVPQAAGMMTANNGPTLFNSNQAAGLFGSAYGEQNANMRANAANEISQINGAVGAMSSL